MKMLKVDMAKKIVEQEGLIEALNLRTQTAIEDSDLAARDNLKLKGIIAHLEIELATVKGYATRVIQEDNAKIPAPAPISLAAQVEAKRDFECGELRPFRAETPHFERIQPFSLPNCDQPNGEWNSVKSATYPYNEQEKRTNWYEL